eukprot:356415-Chlamydomonas_euryale.AAC.2
MGPQEVAILGAVNYTIREVHWPVRYIHYTFWLLHALYEPESHEGYHVAGAPRAACMFGPATATALAVDPP